MLHPLPLPPSKLGPAHQLSLPVTRPRPPRGVSGILALPSSHTCLLWNTEGFFLTAQELSLLLRASMGPYLGAYTPFSEADLCFSKKGSHSEEVVAAAFGSCPSSPLRAAGLFFTRKNHQGLDALGQVFALSILKLQMFPDFIML